MLYQHPRVSLFLLFSSLLGSEAFLKLPLNPRQLPAEAENVTTITSPTGVTIRYKEPGNSGVCETTPGVNS
jgi:hypothetical protein